MKKIKYVFILLLIGMLTFAFAACKDKNNDEEGKVGDNAYGAINDLIGKVSCPFTITSKTTADGDTFNGTYVVTESNGVVSVAYSYEELSTFETVNGELVAPPDYKRTATGSVKIKDGKVIELSGEEANLSAEAFNLSSIVLSEDKLSEVTVGDGEFSAKITSLKAVTGIDVSAESATIDIKYTEEKITSLTLSYSTSSCQTEIKYAFN